ncbi:hypothetical protein ACM25N_06025 [Roseovarius sp. C7]|uniref:hypothetical protein n=1 Tax=Roseovarius sp. C7 TaxID=3398643 RepID=UPI0039F6E1FC
MTAAAIAIASVGIMGLGAAFVRDQRQEKDRRRSLLAGCRGALEGEVLSHDHAGYPALTGQYDGYRAELRLVVDMIQLRKLPVLWMQATLHRPVDISGALSLMKRASNTEFFSPHGELDHHIRPPQGFPPELSIKASESAAGAGWATRLADPALDYFALDRAKEILITPRGVRLTWRVAETERGHYLTTRLARFETAEIDREGAQALLARAAGLAALQEVSQ